VTLTDRVDWRMDLGAGRRVALVQAGTFTSDAGTIFGPVPRVMWERLVAAELNPDSTLTQALNCLLVETPDGRVLVETGVGDRLDERRRAQRGVAGPWIVAALQDGGFDPATVDVVAVSHLHWDHAGGFLTAAGGPAFPRARIVAQRLEWQFALGDNPRLQASYEQAELRLVEAAGLAGAADGRQALLPGVEVLPTGGHTGGSQAVVVRGRHGTVGFFGDLCMRPWSANPRWVPAFDDFPLTSVEVKATLFREAAEEGWTIVLSHEPRQPIGRFVLEGERIRFEPTTLARTPG
jgi:glyoxylase-like metal-dependent hydrolase (beta-lactamase superfamily II)